MVDRELFSLYVEILKEGKWVRERMEELMNRQRAHMESFQARMASWKASGPHDPAENLGITELSKAMSDATHEMTMWRVRASVETNQIDDDLVARAEEMLESSNYDLADLLSRRLSELQRRINEQWPTILALFEKYEAASTRFDLFVDECNMKST